MSCFMFLQNFPPIDIQVVLSKAADLAGLG